MKKQICSLLFATTIIFSSYAATNNAFSGLSRSIEASADKWIENFVSKIDKTKQLMYLNFFIQPSLSSSAIAMKCMEHIQADSSLAQVSTELEQTMQHIIGSYITNMQKKFESLNNNSPKAVQNFVQKLEKKIYELMAYFCNIYYTKLYNLVEKEDATMLYYMFDEQVLLLQKNALEHYQSLPFK